MARGQACGGWCRAPESVCAADASAPSRGWGEGRVEKMQACAQARARARAPPRTWPSLGRESSGQGLTEMRARAARARMRARARART